MVILKRKYIYEGFVIQVTPYTLYGLRPKFDLIYETLLKCAQSRLDLVLELPRQRGGRMHD